MGARQRKEKKGAGGKDDDTTKRHHHQHQQQPEAAAGEDATEERMQQKPQTKSYKQKFDKNSRSAFARAASLSMSDEDEGSITVGEGGGVSTTFDPERIQREKERKKYRKEQEKMRNGRQEGSSSRQQKKGGKTPQRTWNFLESFIGNDFKSFKSRLASWSIYLLVGGCILGIFVLKALEEYYGLDEDVGGETKLQHLSVLGLEDGASESDIRRAYRTLSVRWHPDRNTSCGASCQQRFQQVAAAYEYLMRKQKKMHADDDNETNETSGLRITSQGVVDFSGLGPKDPFPPSTDTKHVWSVMVHQDKDDWSQSVYEMWQESSRTLGKYVKFGVISIRGRSGKEVLKKLPIHVKIYPAILLMTAGMHPEQYPNISRPSVDSINRFIADAFPSNVEVVHHVSGLRSWISSSISPPSLSSQYKALIIPSINASLSPSLLVKHAAFANKEMFSFCYFSNSREALNTEKEDLVQLLKNPPSWMPHEEEKKTSKSLELPVHLEEIKEEDLITSSSNIFLLQEEGRGVSITQAKLVSIRSKLLNPATALSLALDKFRDTMQPLLYQQTSASLCKGSLQRRVFCLVAIEPSDENNPFEFSGTIDLGRIKKSLKESKQKYLRDNPNKDLDAIWEKAVLKAMEYEMDRKPREGDEEKSDFLSLSKEIDEIHIEQPEDVEEEIIHVQMVRVALGTPITIPSLPPLPPDGLFMRFLKENMDNSPVFLLDLEGSRAAVLPPLFVENEEEEKKENNKKEKEKKNEKDNIYRKLYQTLDEFQTFNDDDDDEKNNDNYNNNNRNYSIVFKPLPDYCKGQDFAKKCLASEQKSWLMMLFSGWSLMQVLFVAASVAVAFVCWNKMTAEMFVVSILLFSLAVGAWATLQPILSGAFGF